MFFYRNYSLKELSNFRAGGIVSYYTEINDSKQIPYLVDFANRQKKKLRIIGNTTNILFSDNYLDEVIFKINASKVKLIKIDNGSVELNIEAGMKWDDLVEYTLNNKCFGLELLSGIPGTVGAAPVQNIGAYGEEISNFIKTVEVYDTSLNKSISFDKHRCNFGYRDSIFKQFTNRYIIQSVNLKLSLKPNTNLKYDSLSKLINEKNIKHPTAFEIRNAILEIRKNKFGTIKGIGTAGSFFKNVYVSNNEFKRIKKYHPDIPHVIENEKVKLFTGWLIEQAGWKGKKYKNVTVSDKNALILRNVNGKASAGEIFELATLIKSSVFIKFKIKLKEEVELIGF